MAKRGTGKEFYGWPRSIFTHSSTNEIRFNVAQGQLMIYAGSKSLVY